MALQDPKFSLNPVTSAGDQIVEAYLQHNRSSKGEARRRAPEMLDAASIRDPERVMRTYPHKVSGGMGQRIMIAMMLIPELSILIAELNIMDGLVRERGMGLIFIGHDLNLVAELCDRVLIMYAGRIPKVVGADRLLEARHSHT